MSELINNPESRFQLIQTATALPGSCVTCGTSNGPFIDFGFLAEYHGAIIFCVPCAQDCGRSAGLVDAKTAADVDESFINAKIIANAVPSVISDYEADINAALAKLRNALDADYISVLPSVEVSGQSEINYPEELGTFNADSESVGGEGSDGISGDTGSNGLFDSGTNSKSE